TSRRKRRTVANVSFTEVWGSIPGRPPPKRVWTRSWRNTSNPTPGVTRTKRQRTALEPKSIKASNSDTVRTFSKARFKYAIARPCFDGTQHEQVSCHRSSRALRQAQDRLREAKSKNA